MLKRGKVRVIPTEKVQAVFDAFDSSLNEELKTRHPIEQFGQLKEKFPNEWMALVPTQVGPGLKIIAARLVGHAPEREVLDKKLKSLQAQYPELAGVTFMFAGLDAFGGDFAVA